MALSQKHSGKILVPWYNSHEWKYVYTLLYSNTSSKLDKQKAIEVLQIWKSRMPILFAGLEGTLIIVNAILQDENTFSKDELSSFYGLAIMRFLNLCAAHGDQQGTFYRIAKARNLPEWLVNIRHDLAHSQKQSSLFMLKKGLEYCFEWLKREYWEIQDREIADFIIPITIDEDINEKFNLYCGYVIASITDTNLSKEMMKMLKEIKANKNSSLNEVLERLVKNKQSVEHIADLVIENGCLLEMSSTEDMDHIPSAYVKGWEPLLQYLCKNNIVMKMIRYLHNNCINNDDYRIQKLSSFWLNEIFKGLNLNLKRMCNGFEFQAEVNPDLSYVLSLPCLNDKLLSELKIFANEAIETPHIHFRNYIASLMTLCGYKDDFIEVFDYFLIEYFHPHTSIGTVTSAPMTLDNIYEVVGNCTTEDLITNSQNIVQNSNKKWEKITDRGVYEGCPIGILPHQRRDCNPTINF